VLNPPDLRNVPDLACTSAFLAILVLLLVRICLVCVPANLSEEACSRDPRDRSDDISATSMPLG